MTIALGDLIRVNYVGMAFNQRIMLTTAYAVDSINPAVSESVLCNAILNELRAGGGADLTESDYLAVMPPQYTLQRIVCQKVAPVRYAYFGVNRGSAGAHAAAARTGNLSAAVVFKGALGRRDNIATHKIGPIPEGATVQADGLLTVAYKDLLDTLADSLTSNIAIAAHGALLGAVIPNNAVPGSFTKIVDFETVDTVRTMSRRTVGRGE